LQFLLAKTVFHRQVQNAKIAFLKNSIMDNAREPTKPLSILNKLLGSKESIQLPSRESLAVVANDFASYFFVKVDSICSSLSYQSMQIFTIGHTEFSSFFLPYNVRYVE
jgi:hypothetical protein